MRVRVDTSPLEQRRATLQLLSRSGGRSYYYTPVVASGGLGNSLLYSMVVAREATLLLHTSGRKSRRSTPRGQTPTRGTLLGLGLGFGLGFGLGSGSGLGLGLGLGLGAGFGLGPTRGLGLGLRVEHAHARHPKP